MTRSLDANIIINNFPKGVHNYFLSIKILDQYDTSQLEQTVVVPVAFCSGDKQWSRFSSEHLSFRDRTSFVGKLKRRYKVDANNVQARVTPSETPEIRASFTTWVSALLSKMTMCLGKQNV